ncbi:MAG: hypothetical protein Q9224_006737, partial [Gallowayella concinna]
THTALGGLAEISGNSRLALVSSRVGGISKLYSLAAEFFGQRTKSTASQGSTSLDHGSPTPGKKDPYHTTAFDVTTPTIRHRQPSQDGVYYARSDVASTGTVTTDRGTKGVRMEVRSDTQFRPPPSRMFRHIETGNETLRYIPANRPQRCSLPPPLPQRSQVCLGINAIHVEGHNIPPLPPRRHEPMETGAAQASRKRKPPAPPPKSLSLRLWTPPSSPESLASGMSHMGSTSQLSSSTTPYLSPRATPDPPSTTTAIDPP